MIEEFIKKGSKNVDGNLEEFNMDDLVEKEKELVNKYIKLLGDTNCSNLSLEECKSLLIDTFSKTLTKYISNMYSNENNNTISHFTNNEKLIALFTDKYRIFNSEINTEISKYLKGEYNNVSTYFDELTSYSKVIDLLNKEETSTLDERSGKDVDKKYPIDYVVAYDNGILPLKQAQYGYYDLSVDKDFASNYRVLLEVPKDTEITLDYLFDKERINEVYPIALKTFKGNLTSAVNISSTDDDYYILHDLYNKHGLYQLNIRTADKINTILTDDKNINHQYTANSKVLPYGNIA